MSQTFVHFLLRHEFIRFLLTGGLNTAVSWTIYLLLNLFLPYAVAYSIAYIFGMVFTYYLNTRWVFKVPMKWSTFMQFPVIFVIRYCLDLTVLYLLVSHLPVPTAFSPAVNRLLHPETYGPLLTIVITMPIGFLLSRLVLKRHATRHE